MNILRSHNECLKPDEKEKLEVLFSYSPELKEAYNLALKLSQSYNTPMSKEEALLKINGWVKEVENSRVACFTAFIKTLKKNKDEILTYFINRHTNGFFKASLLWYFQHQKPVSKTALRYFWIQNIH